MAYTFAGQWGPETFVGQNTITDKITLVTSLAVYTVGTSTLVSLFTDRTKAHPGANPLAVAQPVNSPGVDVEGNALFFAAPGRYDILVNGTDRHTITVYPDADDLAAAISPPDISGLVQTAGDTMIGDLTFAQGFGPVVIDTATTAPVRISVSNGTLSLPAQPGAGANNSMLVIRYDAVSNAWPLRSTATLDPGQPVMWMSFVLGSGLPPATAGYAIVGIDCSALRNS